VRSGDVHLAYQVVGDGPVDLLLVSESLSHLELRWQEPSLARSLRQLASFSRLIMFDKRGTGLSDPVPITGLPTMEERVDDMRARRRGCGSRAGAGDGDLGGWRGVTALWCVGWVNIARKDEAKCGLAHRSPASHGSLRRRFVV
jgi:pimeloyl-ACP methyl ester carboxylesterase